MENGYGAMYSRERFGHGLTPDHFAGYKKQRFRWAYGAMQIMKAHAGKMFSNATKLTFWQKYHFVAGWLPWFADALNLIFTWAGLAWVLAVLLPPLFGIKPVGLPPAEFILPTIGIFVFKLVYSFGLYADRVRCTFRQSLGASLAGPGAHLHGGPRGDLRPGDQPAALHAHAQDGRARHARHGARHGARRGGADGAAVARRGGAVVNTSGAIDPEARLWSIFMLVQSLPFAPPSLVSVVNALEQMRHAQAVFETARRAGGCHGGDAARTIGHAFRGTRRHRPVPETLVAPAPCHGGGGAERPPARRGDGAAGPCREIAGPRRPCRSSSAPAPAKSPRRCWRPASAGERLALVERDPELAAFLRRHFRGPRIIEGDAARLPRLLAAARASTKVAAVVSSLPLLSLPAEVVTRHRARRVRGAAAAARRWCNSPTVRRRRCRAACARTCISSARAAGASGATCRRPWSGPSEGRRRVTAFRFDDCLARQHQPAPRRLRGAPAQRSRQPAPRRRRGRGGRRRRAGRGGLPADQAHAAGCAPMAASGHCRAAGSIPARPSGTPRCASCTRSWACSPRSTTCWARSTTIRRARAT